MVAVERNDGRTDFDFLHGRWDVRNRRLTARLSGSDDWEEFGATAVIRPILGGLGNIDEIRFDPSWRELYGCTVRLFDPVSRQWSLHWSDSAIGRLLPPMIGLFRDGVGVFHAHEQFEGRMVFSRFIWSDITDQSARWQQALSDDGGLTWETNWTMSLSRLED